MLFPSMCTDGFFKNPDNIVKYANTLTYHSAESGKWPGVRSEALHKINQLKKGVKFYSLHSENFTEEFDSMDTLVLYCLNNGVDPNAYVTVNDKKTNERLEDFLIE